MKTDYGYREVVEMLIEGYKGPGSSALPTLAGYMRERGEFGATLVDAQAAVVELTGLSDVTVWKAWLVLLDIDALRPSGGPGPRLGRHSERHVWAVQ